MEFTDPHRKYYNGKVNQFKYDYGNPIATQIAMKCVYYDADCIKIHTIKTIDAIEAIKYVVHIVREWNDHSRELNGYKPCHFLKQHILLIYNQLTKKTYYTTSTIQFRNVRHIYNALQLTTAPHKSHEKFTMGIFLIISKFARNHDAEDHLHQCLDIVIKMQFIYYIGAYKSRKGRAYTFPWDYLDPVAIWREKTVKKREEYMRRKAAADKQKRQGRITKYFLPTKSQQIALELSNQEKALDELLRKLDREHNQHPEEEQNDIDYWDDDIDETELLQMEQKISIFGTGDDAQITRIINSEEILLSQESNAAEWDTEDEEIAAIMEELARDNATTDISKVAAVNQDNSKTRTKRRREESPEIEILNDCPPSFRRRKRRKIK